MMSHISIKKIAGKPTRLLYEWSIFMKTYSEVYPASGDFAYMYQRAS
jgi:hypothetical protein